MDKADEHVSVIILAAGKGTRMKSDRAKVLHEILGKSMISYVVKTAMEISNGNVIVVVGHQAENVKETVASDFPEVIFAHQKEQLGTGHAVLSALPQIADPVSEIVILCGDVPMISGETIHSLILKNRNDGCDISLLSVEMENPTGYGRIVLDSEDHVLGIVEEADATPEQKAIRMVNSGVYCINSRCLKTVLTEIKPDNAQKEYYLTDIVKIGNRMNFKVGMAVCNDANEVTGINDINALQQVENLMKKRSGKIS